MPSGYMRKVLRAPTPTDARTMLEITSNPGGTALTRYNGNPNGAVTAQYPAAVYSTTGDLWVKVNDTLDSSGWVQVIGGAA